MVVSKYSRNLVFLNRKMLFDAGALAGAPGLVFKAGSKSLLCSSRMHLFDSVPGLSVSEAWMDFLAGICLKGGFLCQLPEVCSAMTATIGLMTNSRLSI